MRSIKTDGVLVQLALHACRAPLRQAFEVVEQRGHAAEAGDDLRERSCAALFGCGYAWGVGVRQPYNLSRALMDQQADAVFQGGDVGFEFGAHARRGGDRFAAGRVFEAADDDVDVVARDLSQPRDGVEREQDAQEGDQQIDHGRQYAAGLAGRGLVVTAVPQLKWRGALCCSGLGNGRPPKSVPDSADVELYRP